MEPFHNDTHEEQQQQQQHQQPQPLEQPQVPQMMATRPLAHPTGRFVKPFNHPYYHYAVPYPTAHHVFATATANSMPVPTANDPAM